MTTLEVDQAAMRAVTVVMKQGRGRNINRFRSLLWPAMGLQLRPVAYAPFMSAEIIVLKSRLRGNERGGRRGRLNRERRRRKIGLGGESEGQHGGGERGRCES